MITGDINLGAENQYKWEIQQEKNTKLVVWNKCDVDE